MANDTAVRREIVVLIAATAPPDTAADLARSHRLRALTSESLSVMGVRAQLFRIEDARPIDAVIRRLAADRRVVVAQRNWIYHRQATLSPEVAKAAQYALAALDVPLEPPRAVGRNIPVAIIDTAIDEAHPDLAGTVAKAFDATSRSLATTADPSSANTRRIGPLNDPADFAHGTAVAGIVAGHGLVQGVAPGVRLLSVKAFTSERAGQPGSVARPAQPGTASPAGGPRTTTFILLRAIDWSVREGARVINLSLAGPHDRALELMLEAAYARHVVLVAAAGNGGPTAAPVYPAAYPFVIAVTALDQRDRTYAHANRGSYIALSAPGVDILVPAPAGGHEFMSGTSIAAAFVTGIVALLLEREPALTPAAVEEALMASARDLGPPGRDPEFGAGRAQARAALTRPLSVSR